MKKLLVILLVLSFGVMANAAVLTMNLSLKSPQDTNGDGTVTQSNSTVNLNGKEVLKNATITVNLVSDMITIGVSRIDFNGGTWGTISALGAWQLATTTQSPGTLGTNVITSASATASTGVKWAANANLYAFSSLLNGESGDFTIGMLGTDIVSDGSTPAKSFKTGSTNNILVLKGLHVTPEPMTMSLLALGGLAVLRRRHA